MKFVRVNRTIRVAAALILFLLVALVWAKERRLKLGEYYFRSFAANLERKDFALAKTNIEEALENDSYNTYYASSRALLAARIFESAMPVRGYLKVQTPVDEGDLGLLNQSIDLYTKSLEVNSLDDGSWHNIAWLYRIQGQTEKAVECFHRAITLSGDVPLYHISHGLLLESESRRPEAFSAYSAALRISPSIVDSLFFADLKARHPLETEQMLGELILELEKQRSQEQDPIDNSKLGTLYLHVGRKAEAEQVLLEAVNALPNLSYPRVIIGDILGQKDDYAGMLQSYQRATFLDRNDFAPLVRSGDYFASVGRKTEAVEAYRKGMSIALAQYSAYARRVPRIYKTPTFIRNDMVPRDLSAYSRRDCDLVELRSKLLQLIRGT